MYRFLLATALVASTSAVPASATDWVLVDEGDEAFTFVNRSSIQQSGAYKRAWIKLAFVKPTSETEHLMLLNEYDCSEGRSRRLQLTSSRRNGRIFTEAGDRAWQFVTPGSVAEIALDYVCFGRLPQ